jgi:hypothetical protein
MYKTLMLAVALLLSAAWLQAQTMEKGSSKTATSNQTSVEGCLHESNGTFKLTDNAGTTYTLEGDTSKLTEHVGHEVEITGTHAESTSASGSSSAMAPGGSSHSLNVQKVKHISKTCKSASK